MTPLKSTSSASLSGFRKRSRSRQCASNEFDDAHQQQKEDRKKENGTDTFCLSRLGLGSRAVPVLALEVSLHPPPKSTPQIARNGATLCVKSVR